MSMLNVEALCLGALGQGTLSGHIVKEINSTAPCLAHLSRHLAKANGQVKALLGQRHIVEPHWFLRHSFEARRRGTLWRPFILSRSLAQGRQRSTYHMWRLLRMVITFVLVWSINLELACSHCFPGCLSSLRLVWSSAENIMNKISRDQSHCVHTGPPPSLECWLQCIMINVMAALYWYAFYFSRLRLVVEAESSRVCCA